MIKSMLVLLIFALNICSLISVLIFAVDVIKWHDKEKRVKITPSKQSVPPEKIVTESEVTEVGDDDGKYNTSAFLGSGLQS
ncbi:MAG: hypothetical protein K6G33_00060 [Ruminococcus sp.]|uniref:hypothetical protein n=1 Tax=Ruminococcus sp. TaxID=41978 RepID=UPI0025F93A8A|nr:hypothetical protein [Ruminococcus sp.]MCR5599125.1 hypothetical protein [Ruminococcus sp.]